MVGQEIGAFVCLDIGRFGIAIQRVAFVETLHGDIHSFGCSQ